MAVWHQLSTFDKCVCFFSVVQFNLFCRVNAAKFTRKRVQAPTIKPKLDIRIAPVKKRAVELISSTPSTSSPPATYHGSDGSRMKPARTRSSLHELGGDGSSEPFSGRLRKRSSAIHSYEELSDIDSDDDKGSTRRRKGRLRLSRKDGEVNNNSDAGNSGDEGASSTSLQASSEERRVEVAASTFYTKLSSSDSQAASGPEYEGYNNKEESGNPLIRDGEESEDEN